MKNPFYFSPEKGLFILKAFNFFFDLLVKSSNSLVGEIILILKFMMTQPRKQTIAIHILPNIARSKSNETIKFGQLIQYDMRNTFLEKYKQIMNNHKLFPDSFLKNEHIS